MAEPTPNSPPGAPSGLSPGEQAILEALAGVSRRIDRLEARLDGVERQASAAVAAAGALGDTVDQRIAKLQDSGVDVDQRALALGRLGLAATDPALMALLEKTLQQVAANTTAIDAAMGALQGLPGVVATAGDVLDQKLAAVVDGGVDLDQRAGALLRLTEQATRPDITRAMGVLIDKINVLETLATSAVLERQSVELVGIAGRAMVQTRDEQPAPAGAFAALRALSDPDVQRALGFALRFGQLFGQALVR
ncbi:MAG: DUF1641 domain-containing protein [Deltaproteobacteria bacterium]|nr:DUF1641 domain-containing protein [Deltaproteobacteria bacterium]